jgi:deazaflavin-dependent oxidoreductase (nitroreductase family)
MNKSTNALQKIVLRIYMWRAFTAFWPVVQHPLDALIFKLTKGRYSLTEILGGISIIQLTTNGAKTGEARTVPLVSLFDEGKIVLIASNFGQKHNPGWYYNLKAHPRCMVQVNGRTAEYAARQAEGEEREKYWQMAVLYYKGYELYAIRAAHRQIPVMVLEPVK